MSSFILLRDIIVEQVKGITPKYVDNSDVIVLNQKCIRDNNIDFTLAQFHDSSKNFSQNKVIKVGDILINSTGRGTAGRCAFVKELPPGKTVIVDSHILIVRIDGFYTAGCIEYLLYSIENLLQSFIDGSTGQGEFDKERFFNIKVSFPDPSQHHNIYEILANLDAKIELNNRINSELERMVKFLYDYWFVQFDFPDKKGQPYKTYGGKMVYNKTLKRNVPEGWVHGVASDLFKFNPTLSLRQNTEACYIDMNSLPLSGFMTCKPERKVFKGGVKFQNNDVAVARITPCLENGKTALITMLDGNEVGFGSTEFIIIRGKELPLPGFASQLSRSDSFRKFAISNMTGTSGRKRIDSTTLEMFSLPIPAKEILVNFEKIVDPLYKMMTNNMKEKEELIALRDWLLPMLMNGQVTVK